MNSDEFDTNAGFRNYIKSQPKMACLKRPVALRSNDPSFAHSRALLQNIAAPLIWKQNSYHDFDKRKPHWLTPSA